VLLLAIIILSRLRASIAIRTYIYYLESSTPKYLLLEGVIEGYIVLL
jgi:hypothetical protein